MSAAAHTSLAPRFVVGAYASWPAEPDARRGYLDLLAAHSWVGGLEIPFSSAADLDDVVRILPERLEEHVLTDIGATMQRVGADPRFGLASPDADARAAAVRFAGELRDAIAAWSERAGRRVATAVELHSAPTNGACVDALRRSADEIAGWDWCGARVTLEHCDRGRADRAVEKGFLPLDDEIAVASERGLGITLNWGRRCLEEREADSIAATIREVRRAGVLAGVIFSGAAPVETSFGAAWADGHLPAHPDEPASLMTAERIAAARDAAVGEGDGPAAQFLGAKICVPADADPTARVAMIERIAAAAGACA